ncbi:hypothetical protein IU11_02180 [Cellulosimicrobium sp. MM]|nr:hypothetical protein IU11_02180 [Cellulosimicrobium sp. MM]
MYAPRITARSSSGSVWGGVSNWSASTSSTSPIVSTSRLTVSSPTKTTTIIWSRVVGSHAEASPQVDRAARPDRGG